MTSIETNDISAITKVLLSELFNMVKGCLIEIQIRKIGPAAERDKFIVQMRKNTLGTASNGPG